MKKLISMTDFVLEQAKKDLSAETTANNCISYAQFLKQPLTLEMFVPCDEDGNVLEEPIDTIGGVEMYSEQYEKAKEKVLFKGFKFVQKFNWGFQLQMCFEDFSETTDLMFEDKIEDLLTLSFDPEFELTQSAIKQIGL